MSTIRRTSSRAKCWSDCRASTPAIVPKRYACSTRALEGLGRFDEALQEYRQLSEIYVGLEARCRCGLLLKRLHHSEEANQVFAEVLVYARRFNLRVDAEQVWIDTARRSMAHAA